MLDSLCLEAHSSLIDHANKLLSHYLSHSIYFLIERIAETSSSIGAFERSYQLFNNYFSFEDIVVCSKMTPNLFNLMPVYYLLTPLNLTRIRFHLVTKKFHLRIPGQNS